MRGNPTRARSDGSRAISIRDVWDFLLIFSCTVSSARDCLASSTNSLRFGCHFFLGRSFHGDMKRSGLFARTLTSGKTPCILWLRHGRAFYIAIPETGAILLIHQMKENVQTFCAMQICFKHASGMSADDSLPMSPANTVSFVSRTSLVAAA